MIITYLNGKAQRKHFVLCEVGIEYNLSYLQFSSDKDLSLVILCLCECLMANFEIVGKEL